VPGEKPTTVVSEVVAVEDLPFGSPGTRRAVVRWSDGTTGEALRWYQDELMFCEGDLLGKTSEELRGLLHRRDKEFLQS
jgi:hypothetical protein